MNNITIPKWRESWKVDDPEWVDLRKKEWLVVKKSPVLKTKFKKDEIEKIKTFFMTGSAYPYDLDPDDWDWYSYHPDKKPLPVRNTVLLQCWLAPTINLEQWEIIKQYYMSQDSEYNSFLTSRYQFRDLVKEMYPSAGTLFNGRDVALYEFFTPTRLERKDYPKMSDERFNTLGSRTFFQLFELIKTYLNEIYNGDSIAPLVLQEWCDSIVPAFLNCENESQKHETSRRTVSVFNSAMERIVDAKASGSEQIDFAKNMVELLEKVSFPDEMEVVKRNFEKLSKVLN